MISVPCRPSSTTRVGATSKSPTPAVAGPGNPAIIAAASASGAIFLVKANIRRSPILLPSEAIAFVFALEWLIFGQP
jgi:hypothetical protein